MTIKELRIPHRIAFAQERALRVVAAVRAPWLRRWPSRAPRAARTARTARARVLQERLDYAAAAREAAERARLWL